MLFNNHSELSGKHAYISASTNSWLNYSPEKFEQVYLNNLKKQEGTELHAIASANIKHRIKVSHMKNAFYMFINDAIGFHMESEQVLYYSDYCFGTADAISYTQPDTGRPCLRIHDLKTGDGPVKHFNQLDIYAALFCLEYNVEPMEIDIVQRLYQGSGFIENVPEPMEIKGIMNKITSLDYLINDINSKIYSER